MVHVLLVTLSSPGQINPSLQFAKRLIRLGVKVTFATTLYARRRLAKTAAAASITQRGLNFAFFSDGYDDGFRPQVDDTHLYMSEVRSHGSHTLREMIAASAENGCPITCLVYTTLLSWAADVARDLHIPTAVLWLQPATVLDIYYYYFHGYDDTIKDICDDPSSCIELPNLPLLHSRDLPSFMLPPSPSSDPDDVVFLTFKEHIETLDKEENPRVLVNTFDSLESDPLRAVEKYKLIPVGPLSPSTFLDEKDPLDTSSGGDLFEKSKEKDYAKWLNSKPESSVLYISFGSILTLPKKQMEEIASGLLETGRPFLWVIMEKQKNRPKIEEKEEEEEEENMAISCMEELEKQGMLVPWCSQLEVLSHRALGCFVTHCGWNSTLESLVFGVPVVAFPHWTDQGTNAKLIEDVWRTGVRVSVNEEGIVRSEEVKKCIEMVMGGGEKGEELRRNTKKWKELAREAMVEGGSSDLNLKAFVEEAAAASRV